MKWFSLPPVLSRRRVGRTGPLSPLEHWATEGTGAPVILLHAGAPWLLPARASRASSPAAFLIGGGAFLLPRRVHRAAGRGQAGECPSTTPAAGRAVRKRRVWHTLPPSVPRRFLALAAGGGSSKGWF